MLVILLAAPVLGKGRPLSQRFLDEEWKKASVLCRKWSKNWTTG